MEVGEKCLSLGFFLKKMSIKRYKIILYSDTNNTYIFVKERKAQKKIIIVMGHSTS